jgi:hypothetical protein
MMGGPHPVALCIGQTYRRGSEAYQETGRQLIEQKAKLRHGEWLPWLKANEAVLGFNPRTAQRLMQWAEDPELDVETVWGNAKSVVNDAFEPNDPEPTEPEPKPWPEPEADVLVEILTDALSEFLVHHPDTEDDRIRRALEEFLAKRTRRKRRRRSGR